MSIIVAGHLKLKPGTREVFISQSRDAVLQARALAECEDFSVSPDPIDENRVNVFEKWTSREALLGFRDLGPDNDVFSLVEAFAVNEYEINP